MPRQCADPGRAAPAASRIEVAATAASHQRQKGRDLRQRRVPLIPPPCSCLGSLLASVSSFKTSDTYFSTSCALTPPAWLKSENKKAFRPSKSGLRGPRLTAHLFKRRPRDLLGEHTVQDNELIVDHHDTQSGAEDPGRARDPPTTEVRRI